MPLYQQLADELGEAIRAGEYGPGDRIPSEHELAARYALGRPTVRQATEVLVRKRVLLRRRGSGTFVSEHLPEVDLFSLGGTLASFRRSGVTLKTRWLKKLALTTVPADADNPFAGSGAYTVTRLGSVAASAVLFEQLYFQAAVFPAMDKTRPGPAASLSAHVEQHYRIKPVGGRQTFQVISAPVEVAAALKLAAGAPLLLVRRTLDFPRSPSALFAELYCHTEGLVFAQEMGDIHYA